MPQNTLYYGDNLDVLEKHFHPGSVDLVYLDPPFNSQQDYNVLFAEQDGSRAAAQIKAFGDTWRWDMGSRRAYEEVVARGGDPADVMRAFHTFLGESDMLAYLAMMAPRLLELHRVLKRTGSLYLHCDPTASHYLKMLLDAVFGAAHFRNEIIWKRTSGHSDARRYGRVHDVLLYYTKSDDYTWNELYQPYDQSYVEQYYRYQDPDGRRFMSGDLSAAGLTGGGYEYEWKGITRVWRCPRETMERLEEESRIYYTRNGFPRVKRYLDESPGLPVQDVWADIEALRSWHRERLDYPTQKPEALLERIILASSSPGDVVLDPFCGCGTAVAAAQRLDRRWAGIDITHLAIHLIKHRLEKAEFIGGVEYSVVGEPTVLSGAKELAETEPYEFQCWALGKVKGRVVEGKKGADRGIDGRLFFFEDESGKARQVLFSVKGGKTSVKDVRDLRGVLDREKAEIGVLITMQEPTGPMLREATTAGLYESPWGKHPRFQILTVKDLLDGKQVDRPPTRADATFKNAPKARGREEQRNLEWGA